jgi:alkyl hydroperoxide reductase subunit AhpC
MSVRVGANAPVFQAKAYSAGDFTDFRLSDHRGHWVLLYFYPGDFTFVCPTELADLAEANPTLSALDVRVFACSVDSHFVHKAWDDAELSKMIPGGVPYPIISDLGGSIGMQYGVYDENIRMNVRGRFLIDPDGILQAVEILAPSVGRNIDETIRQVEAFQYVRSMGGAEVCPAKWQKGQTTLKPGQDLVGKVQFVWNK